MWVKSLANLIRYGAVYFEPFRRHHCQSLRTLRVTKLVSRTDYLVYVCCLHTNSYQLKTNPDTVTNSVHGRIKKLFDFTDEEAKKFYSQNPRLSINHLNYFETDGKKLNPDVIKQNPWIINCSFEEFRSKLKYLTETGVSLGSLRIAKICIGTRLKGVTNSDLREHIDFFIDLLQCNEDDVLKIFENHRSLVTMGLERLRRITALLMEYGVAKEYIRSDLWTFYRNEDKMRQRLEVARSVGLTPIKPWLLRCNQSTFENVIQRKKEINDILGIHKDLVGYFAERLNCSEDEVRTMAERFTKLLSINVPKVKQMIDVLIIELRFTSDQIRQFPYVFDHNVDTIRDRYVQLLESGCSPIHLHYLCLNNNQLRTFLQKIKRNY